VEPSFLQTLSEFRERILDWLDEFSNQIGFNPTDIERVGVDGAKPLLKDVKSVVSAIVELDWLIFALAYRDELEGHWLFAPERVQSRYRTLWFSMPEFV
jgi:hypothetical protein